MESYRQRVHSEIIFAHLGICAQAMKQEKLSKRVVNLRLKAPKLKGTERPYVVEKMLDRVGIGLARGIDNTEVIDFYVSPKGPKMPSLPDRLYDFFTGKI